MLKIRPKIAFISIAGLVLFVAGACFLLISIQLPREKFRTKIENLEYLRRALQQYSQDYQKQNAIAKLGLPETLDGLVSGGYLNQEDLRMAVDGVNLSYNTNYGTDTNGGIFTARLENRVFIFPLYGPYAVEKK